MNRQHASLELSVQNAWKRAYFKSRVLSSSRVPVGNSPAAASGASNGTDTRDSGARSNNVFSAENDHPQMVNNAQNGHGAIENSRPRLENHENSNINSERKALDSTLLDKSHQTIASSSIPTGVFSSNNFSNIMMNMVNGSASGSGNCLYISGQTIEEQIRMVDKIVKVGLLKTWNSLVIL